jgi:hypothetical protein
VNVFNHVPGVEGCPGAKGVWLTVKAAEPAQEALVDSFVDLIACERECRSCSYAMTLDCDGNCGVCPHNGYCPCVNPVVARSKTALRIIELRPIMLQELRLRAEVVAG